MRTARTALPCTFVLAFLVAPGAVAQSDGSVFSERLRAALDGPHRTPEESARDANRKPVETLAFFGLREDMRVLEGVQVAARSAQLEETEGRGIYALEPFSFGLSGLDAALTFRNLHNLTPRARAHLHRAVFEALRPGGVYGVVDHTRRHMRPDDPENRRRLDPVVAIEEALAAGFVFDGWSDLHHRPDDELRYEVGRRSVTGNTDRFTFRFRKPE